MWRYYLKAEGSNFDLTAGIPLGVFLEDARQWAKRVIYQAKGRRPTDKQQKAIEVEYEEMRHRAALHLNAMTLGRAAEIIISRGPHRGWSQAYADRMSKIFFSNVPVSIQNTPIGEIDPKVIAKVLTSSEVRPGNARALRSLLHNIFWRVHEVGGPAYATRMPDRHQRLLDRSPSSEELFVEKLERSDFELLFRHLEDESKSWRQRLCLRLNFELAAPLSQVMAARWDQILEDRWYPFAPGERQFWNVRWNRINPSAINLIERVFELGQRDFGVSRYWFPSASSATGHIENCDRVWRSMLWDAGWPNIGIPSLASRYRHLTLFVYWWGDRAYATQRQEIAAKLSKLKPPSGLTI